MRYINDLGMVVNATNGSATGGGYEILPMPQTPAPPVQNGGVTPAPVPTTNPLDGIMGMLDGEVMGIPIKWLALGAVAYFFLKK